ncbi:MAG: tail fiber domain-containing protein [Saprospiraceae bacterium]|uniref:Tail fiber domain-containing protein n=1 Tax=Candidatus Opimibacter skivensis TaxID=2982028 RepID=A0A9D7XNA4_9BACT|nr:tail fiber domain-containing protein [Candidatus Opimibacter skivensis]
MKIKLTIWLICWSSMAVMAQNVAINNSGNPPAASAILDISSNAKGILIPRMTTAQCSDINAPASGLLIYDTDKKTFMFYNGTNWLDIASGISNTGWKTDGNAGTTPGTNFIGTTDDTPLVFKTNNIQCAKFDHNIKNYYIGQSAGIQALSGTNNIGIGQTALKNNTGSFNIAIGNSAMYFNTSGHGNLGIGSNALANNQSADLNIAIGNESLSNNTTGSGNTALGVASLNYNSTGFNNVAMGNRALYWNTTKSNLVAVGDSALVENGRYATTPNHSTKNTAIGSKSLMTNTTGYSNTAVGYESLINNVSGRKNTALGTHALLNNVIGLNNTAIGDSSLYFMTSGSGNTAVGSRSLESNSTGYKNTALGYQADVFISNSIYATAIGAEASVNCSNCMTLGGTGAASAFVGINNATPTSDLDINQKSGSGGNTTRGIKLTNTANHFWRTYVDNGNYLRFEYDDQGAGHWAYISTTGDFVNGSDERIKKEITPISNALDKIQLLSPKSYLYTNQDEGSPAHYGFIAQEVETVYPEVVFTSEDGTKGIAYQEFAAITIKAIQEQQVLIENLQQQLNALRTSSGKE